MKRASLLVGVAALLVCSVTAFAAVVTTLSHSNVITDRGVVAQYGTGSYGSALEMEAISDTNTAMYCAVDHADGTTSQPQCGISGHRHTGVGPYSSANYHTLGAGDDVLDTDAHTACLVIKTTTFAANRVLYGNGLFNNAGVYIYSGSSATTQVSYNGAGVSYSQLVTLVANSTNVLCWGRDAAGNMNAKVNADAAIGNLATPGYVLGTAYTAKLGNHSTVGLPMTDWTIDEFFFTTTPQSTAYLNTLTAAALSCRNAGHCLPHDANEVVHLLGDEYRVGGSWCGEHLAPGGVCSATKSFALTGTLPVRQERYTWPSVSWVMSGAVPRVTTSPVYARGYGAKQASLSGWTDANYVQLGAGAGVLHASGVHTGCVRFTYTARPGQVPLNWGQANVSGLYLYVPVGVDTMSVIYPSLGVSPGAGTAILFNETNTYCWGRDVAGNVLVQSNNSTASAAGVAWTPGVYPAQIGRYSANGYGSSGIKLLEFFFTYTSPTTGYLASLVNEGLSCTKHGNCFSDDANVVMHCNASEFTGSTLRCGTGGTWTTNGAVALNAPDVSWQTTSDKRDWEGAGPLSTANRFTLGTGNDVLDFSGSHSICEVTSYEVTDINYHELYRNGTYATNGIETWVQTGLFSVSWTFTGGVTALGAVATAITPNAVNVRCYGYDAVGNKVYLKQNGGTTISGAPTGALIPATGTVAQLGNHVYGWSANVHEFWASAQPASDALFTKIQRRWLNHRGRQDQIMTIAHAADYATAHSTGMVWREPTNTLRSESVRRSTLLTAAGTSAVQTLTPPGKLITDGFVNYGNFPGESFNYVETTEMLVVDAAAVGPNGALVATTVRETVANSIHDVWFDLSTAGGNVNGEVESWYIRPVGANNNCLRCAVGDATMAEYVNIDIDLALDSTTVSKSAGVALRNAGHEHLKDGWLRVWAAHSGMTTALTRYLACNFEPGTVPCTPTVRVGAATQGFDLWASQVETDGATAQAPHPLCALGEGTTCNADTVSVVNPLRPNGVNWTNSVLQSEALGTTWATTNATIATNEKIAPDNSFTMDGVIEDATNGEHKVTQSVTTTAVPWTFSAYCAAGTRDYVFLTQTNGTTGTFFDVTNCAVDANVGGATGTAEPLSGAGNHCRVRTTVNPGAGARVHGIYVAQAGQVISFAGTPGDRSAYCWGMQSEPASTASPYCPTTTATKTCGNGGATGKSVTNLALQSGNLSAVAWSVFNAAGTAGQVDPVGGTTAFRITDTVDGAPASHFLYQSWTATAAPYTLSVWAKAGTKSWLGVLPDASASSGYYDLASCKPGTMGAGVGTIEAVTGGWCRLQFVRTPGAGATTLRFYIANGDTVGSYQGDGTGTVYLWQPQLELSSAAGAYCGPTYATSKTCGPNQRWCVQVKDATPMNGRTWAYAARLFDGAVTGTTNRVRLETAADNTLYFTVTDGDAVAKVGYWGLGAGYTAGSTHTITACANAGVLSLYSDGVFASSAYIGSGTGLVSAWPDTMYLGASTTGTLQWNGLLGEVLFNRSGDYRDFPSDKRNP